MESGHRHRLVALTTGMLLMAALAGPGIAAADTIGTSIEPAFSNNATVEVAAVTFQSKLLVNVTLNVSCEPLVELDWSGQPTGNTTTDGRLGGSVQLLQAQGRAIAHGFGSINILNDGIPVTCDGSTFQTNVAVVSQDLPFKRGDALAGVFVGTQPDVPCCSNWRGGAASTGPVQVRIR